MLALWRKTSSTSRTDSSFVGGKAAGLLRLPDVWVPPFVVLTRPFYDLWANTRNALVALASMPRNDKDALNAFLQAASQTARQLSPAVLVRSNAPRERDIISRGALRSYATAANMEAVAAAIDALLGSAREPVYVIVQSFVDVAMAGHMSNERRVSRMRSVWLVEGLPSRGSRIGQRKIRSGICDKESPLSASTLDGVVAALRSVASRLARIDAGYFHCEWVWDGRRVWIVQADPAQPEDDYQYAEHYIRSKSTVSPKFNPDKSDLTHFRNLSADRWNKLRNPRLFDKLGLPTADIYILSGEAWRKSEAIEHSALIEDLVEMCSNPVVVRCDIATKRSDQEVLLPTSSPMTDTVALVSFMSQVADNFRAMQIADTDWIFLLAQLIPARASAMVQARPQPPVVRVDALWGFPDGLLYFPHDTYFYYAFQDKIKERRRFKGYCVLCRDGDWIRTHVGPPFDWGLVLSAEETRTLAEWALKLATEVGSEIQLMALARIGGKRGSGACLPWHFTQLQIPQYSDSIPNMLVSNRFQVVSSRADLEKLHQADVTSTVHGYLIRPDTHLLRDMNFLREVAEAATLHGKAIYFEGSLLGHAYYIMSRAGAAVIPIGEYTPEVEVTAYHKLVRDYVPTVIRKAGGIARVRTLAREQAVVLLAQKLVEEALEAWNSVSGNLAGELADVMEVLEALRKHACITRDEINQIRKFKRKERGGFERLVYLEETTSRPLEGLGSSTGELPLHLDDSVFPGVTKHVDRVHLRVQPRVDESEIIRFAIPLVPPVESAQPMTRLVSQAGELEVVATYQRNRLEIAVRRPRRKVPSEQLSLFPDLVGPAADEGGESGSSPGSSPRPSRLDPRAS